MPRLQRRQQDAAGRTGSAEPFLMETLTPKELCVAARSRGPRIAAPRSAAREQSARRMLAGLALRQAQERQRRWRLADGAGRRVGEGCEHP